MSLKEHNDIIQAIKHFNTTIQQATWNSTSSSDTKDTFNIHNNKREIKGKT